MTKPHIYRQRGKWLVRLAQARDLIGGGIDWRPRRRNMQANAFVFQLNKGTFLP